MSLSSKLLHSSYCKSRISSLLLKSSGSCRSISSSALETKVEDNQSTILDAKKDKEQLDLELQHKLKELAKSYTVVNRFPESQASYYKTSKTKKSTAFFTPPEYIIPQFKEQKETEIQLKIKNSATLRSIHKDIKEDEILVNANTKFVVSSKNPSVEDLSKPNVFRRNRKTQESIISVDNNAVVESPIISYETQPLLKKTVDAFIKSLASGKNLGIMQLDKSVFGNIPRKDLLELAVRYEDSWLKSGTASSKIRSEVRGGGKRPWPQKGTGRARHASRRSPLFLKGGKVHGPRPHKEMININRKIYESSLRAAISSKYHQGQLIIIDSFEEPVSDFLNSALGPNHTRLHKRDSMEALKDVNFYNGIGASPSAYFVYGSLEPPIWLIQTLDNISPPIRRRDRKHKRKMYEFITTSIENVLIKPILKHEYLVIDKKAAEILESKFKVSIN